MQAQGAPRKDRRWRDAWKKGDVVRLKSGGPAMTVVDPAHGRDEVKAVWMNPTGHGGWEAKELIITTDALETRAAPL